MRYCVRAFKDRDVADETLREILNYARYAACSKNMQPWKVFAVRGDALCSMAVEMVQSLTDKATHEPSRPDESKAPAEYWDRARQCGFSLFQLKDIARDDLEKRQAHYAENYSFINAPLELFFAMDKKLPQRQLIDMGIFLERVMSKAHELGLGSCPQASVADFPTVLRKYLPLGEDLEVLFGLSLGYEKEDALVNSFRTEKLEVDDFTTWIC